MFLEMERRPTSRETQPKTTRNSHWPACFVLLTAGFDIPGPI